MFQHLLADDIETLRPTIVEVDLTALEENIRAVRSLVGERRIMATVKANAYGHGLIRTSEEFLRAGVDELGVAFLEEGIALRKAGITAPILVMGGILGNQISHFLQWDLQITASSVYKLKQIDRTANEFGTRAKVHVKIDTGMGRIGIRAEHAHTLFDAILEASHCDLVGVFSHFASSHNPYDPFTQTQLERFNRALDYFPKHGLPYPIRHIANSGAVLQNPEAYFEMVRPGIILYGVYPDERTRRSVVLRPVLSFKTRVVYFKVVPKGNRIGYDHTWEAQSDTRVVTLPVGYGDGYPRSLSNQGEVLLRGKRYPIVGRISMDQCMVDIGLDSAYNDDEVVLIGEQEGAAVSVEEVAEWAGTIPYEILTSINTRVPRRYVHRSDE